MNTGIHSVRATGWHRCLMLILLVAVMVFAVSTISYAQTSTTNSLTTGHVISYQGSVTSFAGAPLNGDHLITTTLYSDPQSKTVVWSGSYKQAIENGVFTVLLGSGEYPLPKDQDMSKGLWIGVKIDNGEEMQPLTPLTGSPYALSIPDNSITKDKIAADYVGGITVNGKKITGAGTELNLKDGENTILNYDELTNTLSVGSIAGLGGGKVQGTGQWDLNGNNNVSTSNFLGTLDATGGTSNVEIHVDHNGGNSASGRVMLYNKGTGTSPNITGGFNGNAITGNDGSVIAGGGQSGTGLSNSIASSFCVIGGGSGNTISSGSNESSIGGGDQNTIWTNSDHATIAGSGWSNQIGSSSGDVATQSFIGGGSYNHIFSKYGTIGGGWQNIINGSGDNQRLATIAGGSQNQTLGFAAAISGGGSNQANNDFATVGGGNINIVSVLAGTISGGNENRVSGIGGFVGGGANLTGGGGLITTTPNNQATATDAVVVGGLTNIASGNESFLGGGESNTIGTASHHSTIGGGFHNVIQNSTLSGTIGGGGGLDLSGNDGSTRCNWPGVIPPLGNVVNSSWATVGGGTGNTAGSNGDGTRMWQTVGGGVANSATGDDATVAGGEYAIALGDESFVGGGSHNTAIGNRSAIAGGYHNIAGGTGSFVGAGELIGDPTQCHTTTNNNAIGNNTVIAGGMLNTASLIESAVLNGENNTANLAAQSVVGYFNDRSRSNFPTTMAQAFTAATLLGAPADAFNRPLFMVGNGNATVNHNAFEVSYNGHSNVTDLNGSGQPALNGRAAIIGGTYTDNVVYAWGHFNANTVSFDCDFGVQSVVRNGPGIYTVTMNSTYLDGQPMAFDCGSVTATIEYPNAYCGEVIYSTTINGNSFIIHIMHPVGAATGQPLTCTPNDDNFFFKVCARPSPEGGHL